MYAEVEIATGRGTRSLTVPDSAVIDSGTRQVVIVDKGEGRFEPREVKLGRRGDGYRRNPRRRRGRRRSGRLRQLPDRCRKQPEGRPAAASPTAEQRSNDRAAHRLVGPQLVLVLIGTVFAVAAGLYAPAHLPLDAIPDLSDTQVIVYTEYPGQAPQVVEDQVTYPLTTAMLTVPKSTRGARLLVLRRVVRLRDLRGRHGHLLGALARARISQRRRAPAAGGRDADARARRDRRGLGLPIRRCRQGQDAGRTALAPGLDVRYGLAKAEGVAEVASVGGFVKQYNVVVDPQRLRALRHSALQGPRRHPRQQHGCRRPHGRAVRVRVHGARPRLSQGHRRSSRRSCSRTRAARRCCCRTSRGSNSGPDERRGITELNGEGEVASGIVLQRFGANALDVIDNVKARLAEIAPSLPTGVEIVPVYDRSKLIHARHRDAEGAR